MAKARIAASRARAPRCEPRVGDVGLPHARDRLGRLRAKKLAVDVATSSASLGAELHELRVFVVEGLRRRGFDVADAACRRLAQSGASDWLDAFARRQDLLDDAVQDVTSDIDAVVAVGRAADEALDDLFEVESDGDVCVAYRRRGPDRAAAAAAALAQALARPDARGRQGLGRRAARRRRPAASEEAARPAAAAPDVWGFEADDAPRHEDREPRAPREQREPRVDRSPRGEPREPQGTAARRPARAELAAFVPCGLCRRACK